VFNMLPIFGSVIVFEQVAQLMHNDVVHVIFKIQVFAGISSFK